MTTPETHIRKVLAARDLTGKKLVIACSGGPDSMALLHLLGKEQSAIGGDLHVAHVIHGVRAEGEEDARLVQRETEKYGLPFHLLRENMENRGREWKLSDEEAGRKIRYDFFRSLSPDYICLAHTADDLAETVLQRILRGTGTDGLSPMEECRGDLFRPLLALRRRELIAYLEENRHRYRLDHTNREDRYGRNRIRHHIIPALKTEQPAIKTLLCRLSEWAGEDRDYFQREVEQAMNRYVVVSRWDITYSPEIHNLHPAIGKRVIRRMIEIVHAPENPNYTHEILERLWNRGTPLPVPCGPLDIGWGIVFWGETQGYRLRKKGRGPKNTTLFPGNNSTDWGDLTIAPGEEPILLRRRRPGDRLTVRGREKKLKDLLIEEKVPRSRREDVGIMEREGEILAVLLPENKVITERPELFGGKQ